MSSSLPLPTDQDASRSPAPSPAPVRERFDVILDTDLGSDVDDAMAFSQLLGLPQVSIAAVTTVYGDTTLRARLTQRYASLAGRSVAVFAGREMPLSGKEVWWPGHEGSLHPDLETERIEPEDGVESLLRLVAERPGELDLIAIGPLTNIAAALDADPSFQHNVRGLWIMGGAFGTGETEHNFRSDATAARTVFASSIPMVVAGLEITQQVRIRADQLAQIEASGPLGQALTADIQQWWAFWNEEWNVPHDPITVLTLVRPDLFELSERGTVSIAPDGEHAGFSEFVTDGRGSARLVTGIDADQVASEIVRAIVTASSR